MKLKFDSTLLLNNFKYYNDVVVRFYEKNFPVTKFKGDFFDLKENEYTFMKIQDAIYHKNIVDYYTDRHHTKYKEQVNWKPLNKLKKYKIDVYITNLYIHFDEKKIEKIKLSDILEIEVSKQFVTFYTKKKVKSVIYTNSLDISMNIVLLVEMLNHVDFKPGIENKTIKFGQNIIKKG